MNKRKIVKKQFKFTEYHLLIVAAVIFIFQYSAYYRHIINFPKWIYLVLILIAVIVNLLVKRVSINFFFRFSEILRVFKSLIVYLFMSLGIGSLIFGIVNKQYSDKEPLESMKLKIVKAYKGSSKSPNSIYFLLNEKEYNISVRSSPEVYELISSKEKLKRSYLYLECRKGLLGTYVIEEKEIIID